MKGGGRKRERGEGGEGKRKKEKRYINKEQD